MADPSTGKISIACNNRVRTLKLTQRCYDFTVQTDKCVINFHVH
jgi:hypothetical protein